ncbi:MAG: ImmA/IrrE family metallo-endopeptidase [Polyangiaceae bacterium]|nr:ImmA/IrrE family metallo-endopeptidase [Polyangiaceae bacterium]
MAGVSRFCRIEKARLTAIEGGSEPTFFELEELARVFGIDSDALSDEHIVLQASDAPSTLASLDEFRDIGEEVRVRILAAATAAKDVVALKKLLGKQTITLAGIRRKSTGLHDVRGKKPAEQGRELANRLRKKQKMGSEPIISCRDWFQEFYPDATLLYAELGRFGPAGLTFADDSRGATIVLNLNGKNEQPLVRRFSLAHELCHLLVDVDGKTPLAQLSGYLTDTGLEREQRANAFAVRLLCPESVLGSVHTDDEPAEAVRKLAPFGLPYAAVRLYLNKLRGLDLPAIPPQEVLSMRLQAHWLNAEEPLGIAGFPLEKVPPERRTHVAELASEAYSRGLISRDRFALVLGVTPLHEIERVLDFFGVPEPTDQAA